MGFVLTILGIIASVLFFKSEHTVLFILVIISTILSFWSYGIMHNFATNQAKNSRGYSGKFYDITESEAESVPDWITHINIVCSVLGLIFFVISIVFSVFK